MARQYDVVANPDDRDATTRPYLIILQSDLIAGLHSTIVAPLIPRAHMSGANRLNPIIVVNEQEYWLATHELFAVDRRILRAPIANMSERRQAITAALDLIFLGF